ncbi:hypothetical protein [Methylomonas sp. AM2-LC]|uniref:hypothetical protein n=1 Tax=Methylomonas sp. AM2-LC TaxID=3153301 RepID=UPI0032632CD8
MENDFETDPLYGLDKAIKTKLLKLGLSSVDAVRAAVESSELRGVTGIGEQALRDSQYWLQLVDKRRTQSDFDHVDLVLFGLSSRIRYCLKAENLCTVEAVLAAYQNKKTFNRIPNMGL